MKDWKMNPLRTGPISRAELVEFVREVLPEMDLARKVGATSHNSQLIEPTTRSLRITFVLEGRQIIADYFLPLPPEIVELAGDEKRNPWGRLEIRIEQANTAPGLNMVAAEPLTEHDA